MVTTIKKLLLLLILSLFSTQGLAASCPDGNEPTKGLSADGYYFVYTCGSVEPVPIVSPEAKVSSETTSNKSTPEDLGEDDYIAKIKEAKALLDSGIISEEQFEELTQKIIDNI